ncbi:MAG: hypothetical protein DRO06_03370 [Thermoproteota archaeon]|nr:MAG: hypothetical protein DRO06_03370 [Candidatus Korarchaeota archaeon]
MPRVVLFEDDSVELLRPIVDLRPAFSVRCGALSLLDRIRIFLRPSEIESAVREYLTGVAKILGAPPAGDPDSPTLFVNARLVPDRGLISRISSLSEGEAMVSPSGDLISALLPSSASREALSSDNLGESVLKMCHKSAVVDAALLTYPWDVAPKSLRALAPDLRSLLREPSRRGLGDVRILGRESDLMLSEEVSFEGPCLIDLRDGPVLLETSVEVGAFSYLRGPLFVGRGSKILPGSRISNSSIGPVCKVGGEVSDTIVLGYSNKAHHGYLGHSYVGEWVNVGAGTVTSDLKNTYGEVRKTIAGRRLGTGLIKVGAFLSDHVKTSINTSLYTGVSVGAASHVHGFVTRDVPPFTIYAESVGYGVVELEIESAIRTYRRMASRRGVAPSPAVERAMRLFFETTAEERRAAGVEKRKLK